MYTSKRLLCVLFILVLLLGMFPAVHAAAGSATVTSCIIDPASPGTVAVQVQADGIASEDGQLHLFAVPTYVDSVEAQTPVASVAYTGPGSYSFRVPLNANTAASLLYSKFYVGVREKGVFTALNPGNFITNPEQIATSNIPRTHTSSKKGIHIDFYVPTDMEDLNVKHTFLNISYGSILSNTPTEYPYTYNGKTYYFDPVISDYDGLICQMTDAGITMTVTLINQWRDGYEYLIHPGVTKSGAFNYAVNTSTAQGLEAVAAATHFLAERYNGTNPEYGKVENWIFGNEVNDNRQYYYMGQQTLDTFVQEYLQSFRVAYTAIKSAYSQANVYTCLEHGWATTDTQLDYGGKNFIDKFNAYAQAQGNIDWGLSYHPYSYPLNDADILNDGTATINYDGTSVPGNMVRNNAQSPIITMKNINVLTDYFHNSALLNPNGQVRSIILGEQGYTSYSNITGQNESRQAANIALAYYIAEMNPDVDAFLLRGHTDTWEGSDYFKFGIWNAGSDGKAATPKKAYEMYRYLDTPKSLEYTEFAKAALNISDWSEVVPGWNPAKLSSLGSITDAPLYTVSASSGASPITTGMMDVWEPGKFVFGFAQPISHPDGMAVVNGFANYLSYQGIETHFATPLNLSGHRYITMDVGFLPDNPANAADQLELKIRLHSGNSIFDAVGMVGVSQNPTVGLDLGSWSGRSSIDTIEVMIRPVNKKTSFSGSFTVYHVKAATGVSGASALAPAQAPKIDLSGAGAIYQKSFASTGKPITPTPVVRVNGQLLTQSQDFDVICHNNVSAGTATMVIVGIGKYTGYQVHTFSILSGFPTVYEGVDYAAVYDYNYYIQANPAAVAEVGSNPTAVLAHFVTKGMTYALQGNEYFNPLAYAKENPDLQAAFADNWADYYSHYLASGIAEGRPYSGTRPQDMPQPPYPCQNHAPVPMESKEATCLTQGSIGGVICATCGVKLEDPETLAAQGHNYGVDADGNPDFWDTTCDVCGAERKVDKFRPTHSMYRMYNPNSGEHFYTGSMVERQNLEAAGWKYEGVGFTFPATTGKPVYRLYDRDNTKEHLYTMDEAEKEQLLAKGWFLEGVAFNSGREDEVAQYRLHNPNATIGAYHFTASVEEKDALIAAGWEYQGIGFYTCWQ